MLNILDIEKDLSQFNFDTGRCMKRSVQVGFESLDTNKERLSGIRFRYSPVPRLSKINYASLKLKLAEDGKGHSNAQIKVFAIVTGNANYVATCLHNDTKLLGNFITFRLRKTPKAKEIIWTPDISSIIQQRVNEVNYAPGNALVIVLAAVKGDNNEMFHFNFLNDAAPPVLELKYSSPSKYVSTENFRTF